ncbi:hypothetical protein F5Y14DRAFT_456674 [Nemania sp. NC0429]|nr:hypothetical protein F5Y14DRAFT_456674 [Nemania sp. NC0429]
MARDKNIRDLIAEDPREGFFTRSSLVSLLTIETVKKVLSRVGWEEDTIDIQELAQFVIDRALSVFAILIKSKTPHLIESFRRDDFDESMLPIKCGGSSSKWSITSYFDNSSNRASEAVVRKIFTEENGWTYADVVDFHDNQWPFLPLVFTKERFRYEISSNMRLPYTPAAKELGHSNNSRVEKRSIYRGYFKSDIQTVIDDDKNFCVAVKKILYPREDETEKEATALENMRKSSNVHLIKAIAYIRTLSNTTPPVIEHAFVFPWAEHGNLWDFWTRQKGAPRDREYFIRVFRQLTGLMRAINELSESRTRHGDLKPENIVCFKTDDGLPAGEEREPNAMTRLVIIDVGLAKHHSDHTQLRARTDTRVSTKRYAAPELEVPLLDGTLSRRFDIWSMGCIFLEFSIWLIYGQQKLLDFTAGDKSEAEKFKFFDTKSNTHLSTSNGPKQIAYLHPDVDKIISELRENPLCCDDTAMRSLIDLISDKMLVVDLSDDKPPELETEGQSTCENESDAKKDSTPKPNHSAKSPVPEVLVRAATFTPKNSSNSADNKSPGKKGRRYARVIMEELESILARLENRTVQAIKLDDKVTKLGDKTTELDDKSTKLAKASSRLDVPHRGLLNDDWEYTPDDKIARNVLNGLDMSALLPEPNIPFTLCGRCRGLMLWSPTCKFSDSLVELEKKAKNEDCKLCCLLFRSIKDRVKPSDDQQIHFIRVGCYLTLRDDRKQIVANLCTLPSSPDVSLRGVQIGFPKLPEAGDETHLKILKEWIAECDRSHKCCSKASTFCPTRLLDIRNKDAGTIRLLVNDEAPGVFKQYATLSHRWGSSEKHRFRTCKSNIERLKQGIKIEALPSTFQDAVNIAYGLGLQYLWIDSLCIIQGDTLDWDTESKRMESVFSSAYCTIAASCSSGSGDGFLNSRPPRGSVMMQGLPDSDASYFVCETIDDFFRDVEQSELNQRGWVLQERALSRRTIYFAGRQSYWECGEGVRCETMTRMTKYVFPPVQCSNFTKPFSICILCATCRGIDLKIHHSRKASFLGDFDFPRSVDGSAKGSRIEIFQDLYEKYSKLALSYPADRPIAIRGLESRLLNTFGTSGGVGIFDIYLHRSLIWRRAGDTLKSISFRDAHVPSWSWMAYDGPICYLAIPFEEADWCKDIKSPFLKDQGLNGDTSGDLRGEEVISTSPLELEAPVWNLLVAKSEEIFIDDPGRAFTQPFRCVVLGKSRKLPNDESQVHWVLLVYPKMVGSNVALYERVGVGVLRKCDIAFDEPRRMGRIQ